MLGQRRGGGRDPKAQLRGFWQQQPAGSGRHRHGGGKQGLGETEKRPQLQADLAASPRKGPAEEHASCGMLLCLMGIGTMGGRWHSSPQTLNPF